VISFVPSAANAGHYLTIVLEKHLLRRLIQTFEKVSIQCRDQQAEPSLVLMQVDQEISQIIYSRNGDIWTIESGTNLLEANTPLPPELIHGVLHKTLKAELAGDSKTMKRWALIDLALSVSLGASWWGIRND
jgi:hypothetical protein